MLGFLKKTKAYREQSLAWQRKHEPAAPKVGDLAPDFELQHARGERRVRLSEFRGKKPVGLIFGSYT